ncbi:hypothetical protein [Microbispora bryophytorum]|uniref:hypothetical protein n=1 Tax=Microbispora bryophytorum TaxID=1460882 RepID=UPI0033D124F4
MGMTDSHEEIEIPEFVVWRDGALYRARHKRTGRTIEADTVRRLELLASAVRIGATLTAAQQSAGAGG